MPPKKAPAATSKKTETKKKDKIIEDKTFGLKNKKGAKQQKFISQIEKQVKSSGLHPVGPNAKKEEKEKKLKEQKELAMLFKPVQTQKIDKGTDPKSVICAFFKAGQCGKGDKCKFSHDLTIERKVEKRSLYVDMRDDGDGDTMENWNDEKLKQVVDEKHGKEKRMPTTDIICKFFLDAVEKSKYGWFWECPNGERCIYRHALPMGYVLKRDKKKMETGKSELSIEDLIETERAALGVNQTKITLETFLAWKRRKIMDKKDRVLKAEEKKRSEFKAGRQLGLSGREMFSFNPELANDGEIEDGDVAFENYALSEDEDEFNVEYKELDFNALSMEAQEVDGSGTVAAEDRLQSIPEKTTINSLPNGEDGKDDGSDDDEDDDDDNDIAGEFADAAMINENLFLDEDLEGLDDELNELDLDKGD